MVVQAEQDRVKHLLSEALPMLCKSGLSFSSEFCIEALIGITLDKNDVFLVSIKETIQSETDNTVSREKTTAVSVTRVGADEGEHSVVLQGHRKRRHSANSRISESDNDDEVDEVQIKREKMSSIDHEDDSNTMYETTLTSQRQTYSTPGAQTSGSLFVKQEPYATDTINIDQAAEGFSLAGVAPLEVESGIGKQTIVRPVRTIIHEQPEGGAASMSPLQLTVADDTGQNATAANDSSSDTSITKAEGCTPPTDKKPKLDCHDIHSVSSDNQDEDDKYSYNPDHSLPNGADDIDPIRSSQRGDLDQYLWRLMAENMPGRSRSEGNSNHLDTRQFSDNTEGKISWAVELFSKWRTGHNIACSQESKSGNLIPTYELEYFSIDELDDSLQKFIMEIHKKNGEPYAWNTLKDIVFCLQMHLEKRGVIRKLFEKQYFPKINLSLTTSMFQRAKEGNGALMKKPTLITRKQEKILWEKDILGSDSPNKLMKTLYFLIGTHFGLRSSAEQKRLRVGEYSQFEIGFNERGHKYLQYTQAAFKNKPGKCVQTTCNEFPDRCIVCLYEKYLRLRPKGPDDFYLNSLKNPTDFNWYSTVPVGINNMLQIVKNVCEEAGFQGNFTNHSLQLKEPEELDDDC